METLRSGKLEVRLARDEEEVEAAQALRYRVFYDEMGAKPSPEMAELGRDVDRFDQICDHLLVLDPENDAVPSNVVGTYRLMRRSAADRNGGFYTAGEFDISSVVNHPGEILELGRSCVERPYRSRPTMQLLWKGIASYVFEHDIAMMFGCASLPGTDIESLSVALSYLYHNHLAPEDFRPRAVDERYVDMKRLENDKLDPRRALAALPPLVKGYLRIGGHVGDGAVVDHQFNTTDVCVVVKTDQVTDRYFRHYEREVRPSVLS